MSDDWGDQTQEQDWSFDTEGYDAGDLGGGGNVVDKEGWYHFEVSDVKPELETMSNDGKLQTPKIRFDLTVMHSVEGQSPAGSRLYHRIYLASKKENALEPPADGSVKSALRFGLGLGILKKLETEDGREVVVDPANNGTKISQKLWANAKGKHCIAKVKFKPAAGTFKAGYELDYGVVYDPRDPQVLDVKKNTEVLQLAGYAVQAPAAGAVAAAQPTNGAAKPAAAPTPVAAAPADDLGDL